MIAAKNTKKTANDSYFELVKQFPLVPIKSEAHFARALAFLKILAILDERSLDHGQSAYLEALTLFVEDFQNKHHQIKATKMAPLTALKYLMNESAMSPADLGRILGNRSLASQILHGKRELSKANIIALAQHFAVETSLFLPA